MVLSDFLSTHCVKIQYSVVRIQNSKNSVNNMGYLGNYVEYFNSS